MSVLSQDSGQGVLPVRTRFILRDRLSLFSGNVLLAFLWPAFSGTFTVRSVVGGFFFAAIILTAFNRHYVPWLWGIAVFLLHLAASIVQSCLQVAGQILFRRTFEQSIVEYELMADSDIETLILATAITLTPGTISVDTRYRQDGKRLLYVHLLDGRNPEGFKGAMRYGFERRIYELARE